MKRFLGASKQERWAGGLLIVLGLATFWQATTYNLGTLSSMGPGMFPAILGVLLVLLGIMTLGAAAVSAEDSEEEEDMGKPEWRGWGCIIGGVLAFILIGRYGGLVPATFTLVFISALGDRTHTLRSALLLAAFVTVIGIVIFSWGLSLQFPMFRWG